MKSKTRVIIPLLVLFIILGTVFAFAEPPSHDPSTMTKDGSRYWIFTTGTNIWCMSASNPDFTDWRTETAPFAGGWPVWIKNYVPNFAGNFWAPDVVYRNGQFRLYYSCSTFGSQTSCIGLAVSTSLSGPWTDQGVVVYSNSSFQENAIDPAIFGDWLIYGSFFGGIRMAQLGSDGKPLNSTRYAVASGDAEASYLLQNGSCYYLFINRGSCCQGVNSTTYRIQAGRSANITGPYIDKSGRDMNAGGGTDFITTSGRFIGPGHFGYGEGKLTYHFYDGNDSGNAKLMITTLSWADGWPIAGGTGTATNPPADTPAPTAAPTATPGPTGIPTATPEGTPAPTTPPAGTPALTAPSSDTPAPTAPPSSANPPAAGCTCPAQCDTRTTITIPFTYDGAGEFCREASSFGSYINSWNTDVVNVNGVNCTNTYTSSSAIGPVDGKYYLYYKASYSWSHVEVK
jgi:cell division septation protein DedD